MPGRKHAPKATAGPDKSFSEKHPVWTRQGRNEASGKSRLLVVFRLRNPRIKSCLLPELRIHLQKLIFIF